MHRVFKDPMCGLFMDGHGVSHGRGAGAARKPAPCVPGGAALPGALAGRQRTAPGTALGAAPAGTACALSHRPALSSRPRSAEPLRPGLRSEQACRFWAEPRALPGTRDAPASALRHSALSYLLRAGVRHVTVRAPRGAGATGMRDYVEVVGVKCGAGIGGLGVPPLAPAPAKLEGGYGGRSAANRAWGMSW